MPDLQAALSPLRDLSAHYDLVVIGGGINGAGVARDAAQRGLTTLLLEKGDFGSGTTGWSTRLIHGGLRYLQYFEFPLVRESLREREILLRNAPHLVKPIQFTLPLYHNSAHSVPELRAGMLLYDLLSYDKSLPNHRALGRAECQRLFPSLATDGLQGAVQYYDAQVQYAERLCLEVIQAAEALGATVRNYVEVTDVRVENDVISELVCRDSLTQEVVAVTVGSNTQVVNTTGPWLDRLCQSGSEPTGHPSTDLQATQPRPLSARRLIGGTKGSHIFVAPFPGAPDTALYTEAARDGRPYFIVPWLGGFLIGTTDFRYNGDLDRIKADSDEIDYLLEATNAVIPSANLTRGDIRFTYAGVRPLPYREGKSAGAITRKHILHDHATDRPATNRSVTEPPSSSQRSQGGIKNLLSLVGGKLTTHRNSSQEIVDKIYGKLGKSAPACQTASTALPGAIVASDPTIARTVATYSDRVPPMTIHHLFQLYGSKAPDVLALGDNSPELFAPLVEGLPDIQAQVVYAVQHEYARTLTDIAHRRTSLAILDGQYGLRAVGAIADVLKHHCSWSTDRCNEQILWHRTYMQDNSIPDYCNGSVSDSALPTQGTATASPPAS
ncbi:MAG: glycerol-3-phosphate dehydrogenase/oxidase [Cyanobacteria bacterium P01_E01_bin.34]